MRAYAEYMAQHDAVWLLPPVLDSEIDRLIPQLREAALGTAGGDPRRIKVLSPVRWEIIDPPTGDLGGMN